MQTDVLIIGGGAAGLAAAYELSLVNRKLIVLEAQERLGGRICSMHDQRFAQVIETGAEFIHGKLPLTLRLLKKAGIKYHEAEGKMWHVENGKVEKTREFIEGWDEVMKRLKELPEDMAIKDFLDRYFGSEKHHELRKSVLRYVEGYDAADASRASALSLRDEWQNDDDEHQGRIDDGYGALVDFLAAECRSHGCIIHLSHIVDSIKWEKGKVEVHTTNGAVFTASKLLLTIPLGVWQAPDESLGSVSFVPGLPGKKEAAAKMGFGTVIKFNLQFNEAFWEKDIPNKMKNTGFILSDAEIPTWWTQNPRNNALLTGWLAGPKALALKDENDERLLNKAINSLAYIFGIAAQQIKEHLVAHKITNWTKDPFSRGAYSYATLDTNEAKKIMSAPVEDTLYFAGEALYEGSETGTVEGALVSGTETARQIIASS